MEPEYEYIKGQGWVPSTNICKDAEGRSIRLEFREPKYGEHYMRFSDPQSAEQIRQKLSVSSYNGYYYRRTDRSLDDCYCVVMIPVD